MNYEPNDILRIDWLFLDGFRNLFCVESQQQREWIGSCE